MTFDEARAAFPHLGLAAYAYEPGGPVTLEAISEGQSFTFVAATLQDAINRAFPADPPAPPAPEVEPPNVFD